MRLVLLGAPGSGKGTQGMRIARTHAIPQVSTGDILRAEIAAGTPLGAKAAQFVGKGLLVPDDVVLSMMKERLKKPDVKVGFVLDGFPRSIPQAEGLTVLLAAFAADLDAVIKLDVSKRVLLERMTGRWVCGSNCGAVFNLRSNPPQKEGVCDRCGGRLVQREDDTEETVRKRLNVYEASTAPLIDFYDSRGILMIVDGEGTLDEVTARIERGLAERGIARN